MGDYALEWIVEEVLPNYRNLLHIDISANKITDSVIQKFFKKFIKNNHKLKSFALNCNKLKMLDTAKVISDALNSCSSLESMSYLRCGITFDMFSCMIPNGFI